MPQQPNMHTPPVTPELDGLPAVDAVFRDRVATVLWDWYGDNARDFPWRHDNVTAWGVLVSEVMSHQTPMSRVQPLWEQWMRRWPTPADVAAASPSQIIVAWGNLGYPRRAVRLHECATVIVDSHDGQVPNNYQQLCALPGIGDYTASAVMCFAFGAHAFVIDTNIRRVLSRVFDGRDQQPTTLTKSMRERYRALVPDQRVQSVRWNTSLMEFGALHCSASAPACDTCPLRTLCRWVAAGAPAEQRRTPRQTYRGTDRQARGRIMKLLREDANHCATVDDSLSAASLPDADADQPRRVLDSLIRDGLVVYCDGSKARVGLPGHNG